MNLDEKTLARFDQLIAEGNRLLEAQIVVRVPVPVYFATTKSRSRPQSTYAEHRVNREQAIEWASNCRHTLRQVFRDNLDHYNLFNSCLRTPESPESVKAALAAMRAAKDSYAQDMLFDTRRLIQAEVFDDFLSQAEYLLSANYYGPAAVITGAVLEDGLRRLCDRHNIAVPDQPKLDRMNAELKNHGVYNGLMQKNITAAADLRNKAAHGRWTEFGSDDVATMISQVRTLMVQHFS